MALIGKKNEIEIRKLFVELEIRCQKVRTTDKPRKDKTFDSERKNSLKKNKIGYLKIRNHKSERVEKFKYLGVILNEDNNNQIDLQGRIKNANKTFCYKNFLKIEHIKETKIKTKEHNNRQNINICIRNLDTNKERQKAIEYF